MSVGQGSITLTPKRRSQTDTSRYLWSGIVGIDPELVAGTSTLELEVLKGKEIVYILVDNVPENSLDAHTVGGNYAAFIFDNNTSGGTTGTITRVVPDVAQADNPWVNGQVVIIP